MESYAPAGILTRVCGMKIHHPCTLDYRSLCSYGDSNPGLRLEKAVSLNTRLYKLISPAGIEPAYRGLQPQLVPDFSRSLRPLRELNSRLPRDSRIFYNYNKQATSQEGFEPPLQGQQPSVIPVTLPRHKIIIND